MMSDFGEEMTIIEPAKIDFAFDFAPGECHEVATGKCSLEKERPTNPDEMGKEEGRYDFCPDMLARMAGQGPHGQELTDYMNRRFPITLIEHGCGHFAFNDGRHRTCIAQRKGLEVAAVILRDDGKCDTCNPRQPSDDDVILITPPRVGEE